MVMLRQFHHVGLLTLGIATLGLAPGRYELALGRAITERPKTYLDLKFAYTVRQQRDFTCGAAALASILKYHYGMPVTEEMIFWMIVNRYKPEELKQKAEQGFSFEDLIYVAEKLGFKSQAAVIDIAELQKLNGPVILQLNLKRFDHFAVLRKKTDDLAYMSDPLVGQTTLDNAEFKTEFKGPVLAVWPSYVTGDYFSGLSVIRDPISVNRMLGSAVQPTLFSPAPK
jgi:predicted double-glycine peptidase